MRLKKRDLDKIIVGKIIKYCRQVDELVERFDSSYEKYEKDIAFQYSVNMCILQMGELTSRLSEEFKEKHDVVPWRLMKAVRNINAHDYEKIDFKRMWQTLTEDIPALEKELQEVLKIENGEEN